jgi:hypothetical protein
MKKAQVIGQVFIYIITALIIGFVLFFGVRAIMQLVKTADDVRIATFQKDFVNRLKADFDYEKVDAKPVNVPGDFSELCFIELDERPTVINCGLPITAPLNPVITNSWKDCARQNIFLIGSSGIKIMYVQGLKVKNGPTNKYLCVKPVNGIVQNLVFRGYGAGVTVATN